METRRDGIGDQEDKEDFERSGENSLGLEDLERCDCGSKKNTWVSS
jgi:hypothetical protein